jgi:hypothetical protein
MTVSVCCLVYGIINSPSHRRYGGDAWITVTQLGIIVSGNNSHESKI